MKAVVTTGGRMDAAFAQRAGTDVKALAGVRGATMLDRVLAALREAGADRIAVVGGDEVRAACGDRVEKFVPESASGSENVRKALAAWPDDGDGGMLLYATSDLPYVTGAAVSDFVRRVPEGALAVALTEWSDFTQRYESAPPGFGITLAGTRVVNGGLFAVPPGGARRLDDLAARFFSARKQPWRMAGLASPIALLRFALGRLSVPELEALAARILKLPAAAVRECAPELAFDVDTLAEYEYACARP